MNSTPNYGYETHISAISVIDRDIKRVEGKADANAAVLTSHAERITRGEERLVCLSKQKCDVYSKCETGRLLDGKVDKQDGHGLISDECLHQICTNKGDISLLEQYIKELQEQNVCLKEELANKVDRTYPPLYRIEYMEGFEAEADRISEFGKTQEGVTYVNLAAKRTDNAPIATYEPITVLPEGFRPKGFIYGYCYATGENNTAAYWCVLRVETNGTIYPFVPAEYTGKIYQIRGAITFFAAQ